tara:strand:- start:3831 stop:4115 length:285 start_codon:yes stop_codon:yes gene_type:complete
MVKEFIHKGKTIKVNPNVRNCYEDPSGLNTIQRLHLKGELDVYAPIVAYDERWSTKMKKNGYWEDFESASPIPNTKRRNDLPPIYLQWKDAAKS